MVSPETRNSSIRMYQGPTEIRPGGCQCLQPVAVLGADLEVVVDHRQLPVEQEVRVRAVPFHQVQQAVDESDQLQSEGLERVVPLTVPMGVRDHGDPPGGCARLEG